MSDISIKSGGLVSQAGRATSQVSRNGVDVSKKPPPPPPPKKKLLSGSSGGPAREEPVVQTQVAEDAANGVTEAQEVPGQEEPHGEQKPEPDPAEELPGDEQQEPGVEVSKQEAEKQEPEKQGASQPQNGQVTPTRIGRPYTQDGVKYIIDEAQWVGLVPQSTTASQFAIVIQKDSHQREQLSISSPYLQKVFKSVVRYFPEVVMDKLSISFYEPYAPLYFYFEEMCRYVDEDVDPAAEKQDMIPLILFYHKWVNPLHERVRATLSQGSVIFDHLWALYRPGDLLYTLDEFDQPRLYMIAASTYRGGLMGNLGDADDLGNIFPLVTNLGSGSRGRFVIDAWSMNWDGSTQTFSRKTTTKVIRSFAGTRSIASLEFYPLRWYRNGREEEINALCKSLEQRGYIWKGLVSETPSCRYHEGPARELQAGLFKVSQKEKQSLTERVIVDHDGFTVFGNEEEKVMAQMSDFLGPIADLLTRFVTAEAPVQGSESDNLYIDFDNAPPHKEFTQLQAQLCPSTVNCFVLQTKRWFSVNVLNLKDVEWAKGAFSHLVLDDSIKEMLRGLVEQHKKNKGRVMSDVIPSKGQGLVIVLHGPPGVGKTLTAESVAEYTQKPLYPINIGELTAEQSVVGRLQKIFVQASRWDAVLLLDEADVVLEKRSYEDLRRNGIVSVFLRMLEYYRGILFLTTNRLGTMDLAFQSRISIAIKYKALDAPLRRRIWENFINRLDDTESEAKDQLRKNLNDMQEWDLNGRQIRNILTIAQSLALAQGRRRGALKYEHVEQVASETMNFQDYFEEASKESKARLGEMTDRQFQEKKAKQLR